MSLVVINESSDGRTVTVKATGDSSVNACRAFPPRAEPGKSSAWAHETPAASGVFVMSRKAAIQLGLVPAGT